MCEERKLSSHAACWLFWLRTQWPGIGDSCLCLGLFHFSVSVQRPWKSTSCTPKLHGEIEDILLQVDLWKEPKENLVKGSFKNVCKSSKTLPLSPRWSLWVCLFTPHQAEAISMFICWLPWMAEMGIGLKEDQWESIFRCWQTGALAIFGENDSGVM